MDNGSCLADSEIGAHDRPVVHHRAIPLSFWAVCVLVAVVLAFAACLGIIASGVVSMWDEDRGEDWHRAASLLMRQSIDTAMFADSHRRWLLPNTQRSKRY